MIPIKRFIMTNTMKKIEKKKNAHSKLVCKRVASAERNEPKESKIISAM
jgi:hypothetical protein